MVSSEMGAMTGRLGGAERSTVRPRIWSISLAVLALAGLVLYLGRWGNDDAYITFRYAGNLIAGKGLVYNAGERALSTTAALYAVLLAGLGLIGHDVPAVGNVVSAAALVLAAGSVARLAWHRNQRPVGLIAALLMMLSPLLLSTFGAETCLYLAFILAGFYAYDRSRYTLAAAACAGAAMIRPDGVLVAVTLAGYHLVSRRLVAWRPVLLFVGLVAGWYAALTLYFGSPVPLTLLAKQQQGQMAVSVRFAPGLIDLARDYVTLPFAWLHGLLGLAGLVRVAARDRYWLPLLAWTGLYVLAYTVLGVSRYFWYYAPLVPAGAVVVAEGSAVLVRGVWGVVAGRRAAWRQAALLPVSGLLLLVLAPPLPGVAGMALRPDPRLALYRDIGAWLGSNTATDASVGALEVGIIGYYSRRYIVDFAGLIQPDVAGQLTTGGDYQHAAAWAIQRYAPDYVVAPRPALAQVVGSDWFAAAYRPVRSFSDHESLWLTLYQRSARP